MDGKIYSVGSKYYEDFNLPLLFINAIKDSKKVGEILNGL